MVTFSTGPLITGAKRAPEIEILLVGNLKRNDTIQFNNIFRAQHSTFRRYLEVTNSPGRMAQRRTFPATTAFSKDLLLFALAGYG